MQKTIIIDIETRPQPNLVELKKENIKPNGTLKDPEKIKADIENKLNGIRKIMSLDHDYNEIVCIGVRLDGESKTFYTVKEFSEWYMPIFDVQDILVGYNLKSFDIPTIIKIGLKENIKLPYVFLQSCTKKFNTNNCKDLQEILSYNQSWKSLDLMLQIYFGISKKPIDFNIASVEEVVEHNLDDLIQTEMLYNFFKPIL